MNIDTLIYWAEERQAIYDRRASGQPWPWTADPILQENKFCNVFREQDRVTVWLRENWREPYAEHPNLWLALCIARQINSPDTLAEMGFPENDYDAEHYIAVYRDRMSRGVGVFSNAYMITAAHMDIRKKLITKEEFIFRRTIGYLWRDRHTITPLLNRTRTLQIAHEMLAPYPGWGSFLAAQVIADLKYTRHLSGADDWWTWAASGPGSKRGLNRLLGRPLNAQWKEPEWLKNVQALQKRMPTIGGHRLHAQDVQSCLCEYDKYMRIKLGEGRMKSKYRRPE